MNKDQALQIALEALTDFDYDKRMSAIETIKKALETKEWAGLTDEEIFEIHKQVDSMQYLTFGKAIEAKLKEKNYDLPN
jgi:hypothetical protein